MLRINHDEEKGGEEPMIRDADALVCLVLEIDPSFPVIPFSLRRLHHALLFESVTQSDNQGCGTGYQVGK